MKLASLLIPEVQLYRNNYFKVGHNHLLKQSCHAQSSSFLSTAFPTFSVIKCESDSRRTLLKNLVGIISLETLFPIILKENAFGLPPQDTGPEVLRSFKTESGVRVQEILEGSGPEIEIGDSVKFNYVCRRSNGYFVYSTVSQFTGEAEPVEFVLGNGELIRGLEEVLIGMKKGGKRRFLVPPEVGYVNRNLQPQPTEFGPQRALFAHANEPLVFEVLILRVKKEGQVS